MGDPSAFLALFAPSVSSQLLSNHAANFLQRLL